MKTASINVGQLWFGQLDNKPVDFDWSEGYAEKWEFWEATDSDDAPPVVLKSWDNNTDHYFEGPMMSYYYPLADFDGDPGDAAESIRDLPLCVVRIEERDEYGLALTGGGMDLSWEICEAFMRLGFLPPVHFCELPQMAGRGTSARDRKIIAACRRSLRGRKAETGRTLRRLRENFKAGAVA